jgi:hypothetical protein
MDVANFHTRYWYVQWLGSQFDDHEDFYSKLRGKMPSDTLISGIKVLNETGRPDYHVVMKFSYRVCWRHVPRPFVLERSEGVVDTADIRIKVSKPDELIADFLERTQYWIVRNNNPRFFGERIDLPSTNRTA